jgi:hypothetical protein
VLPCNHSQPPPRQEYLNKVILLLSSSSSSLVGRVCVCVCVCVFGFSYGVDKFVLLRVGPFPDIYESLARGHAQRGDEASSLIAAEAANGKISGFGSTFLWYAKLLHSFPHRHEEARDAARMCLRLPLSTIGLTMEDFRDVAVVGQMADRSDSDEEVMAKLQARYERIKQHENDDPRASANEADISLEQRAMNEANYLLDTVVLTGSNWSDIRPKLAEIYKSVGRHDLATFVYPRRT